MARARNIKPGLFKNELLVEQTLFVRMLFIGLWTLADREGRLEDRPKRIKLELFPYDQEDTDAALQVLSDNGFIVRYEADGKKVIQIVNFLKHQTPHGTEKDSELPNQDGEYTVNERNSTGCVTGKKRSNNVNKKENNVDSTLVFDAGLVTKRPDSLNPESLILNPEKDHTAQKTRLDDYSEEFISAWTKYPSRPGANKSLTFKAWTARINEGVSADSMIAGVVRYSAYCKAVKTEPNFIKQASSFFGPHKHFESDWSIPVVIHKHKTPAPENFSAKDYGVGGLL